MLPKDTDQEIGYVKGPELTLAEALIVIELDDIVRPLLIDDLPAAVILDPPTP